MNGTVTLITGGGGALAAPVARAFAEGGSTVVLTDVKAPTDRAVALGGSALAADLMDRDEARRVVRSVVEVHGRIDHVIHTVGGFRMGTAWEEDIAAYDHMMDLNLRTLVNVGAAALPVLRERGSGMLAAISAGQAWSRGAAGVSLYAAAKAAVATWMRSVDAELTGTDVRATVVYPMGVIDTGANRAAMPDADPAGWIDGADLASALVFAATTSRRGRIVDLPVYPGRS